MDRYSRPGWTEYFLDIAKAVGRRSTCFRRRYGAIIVKDKIIISTGYNGAPRGEANCIDTGVCAASTRKFNEEAASLENTVVINVSRDLPFALGRFCAAEGINNVETLSDFRGSFGEDNGLTIADSPLQGLLSRAVIVADENGKVIYTEQVPEIAQEPNYTAAIDALK